MEGDTLIIDGDSIPYVLGWTNRDHTDEEVMKKEVHSWMRQLLIATGARKYLGILAGPEKCFRYDVYLYKLYKGNRKPREEWIKFWEPIIKTILIRDFNFLTVQGKFETDDVIAALVENNPDAVMCSPDKDLKQIAGWHYNYKDMGVEGKTPNQLITPEQASYIFHMQLLTGDTTDNIAGVSGMGDKKAKDLLDASTPFMYTVAVKLAFEKQYGPYYGPMIYEQTYLAIRMMTPSNIYWGHYGLEKVSKEHKFECQTHLEFNIDYYKQAIKPVPDFYEQSTPFH